MQSELSPSDTSCFKDRHITGDVIKLSRSLTTSPLFSQGFFMLGVEGLVQLKNDSYIRMHLFFLSEHDVRWALFLPRLEVRLIHMVNTVTSLPSAHLVFRIIVAKCQRQWCMTIPNLLMLYACQLLCTKCFNQLNQFLPPNIKPFYTGWLMHINFCLIYQGHCQIY